MTRSRFPAAALFDMDGTLVNSEPAWSRAELAMTSEFGVPWSLEDSQQLTGWALERAADFLIERGIPLGNEEVISRLERSVIGELEQDIPWVSPAYEILLECLVSGVPTALVTMSRRVAADIVIARAPAGAFTVSIVGDEVRNGKPHPEPYLLAAAALGVDPAETIAFEDSVTGATAAVAAGCTTYTTGPHAGSILGLPALRPGARLADLSPARLQT